MKIGSQGWDLGDLDVNFSVELNLQSAVPAAFLLSAKYLQKDYDENYCQL